MIVVDDLFKVFFLICIMLLPIVTGAYTFYKSYKLIEDNKGEEDGL